MRVLFGDRKVDGRCVIFVVYHRWVIVLNCYVLEPVNCMVGSVGLGGCFSSDAGVFSPPLSLQLVHGFGHGLMSAVVDDLVDVAVPIMADHLHV